jgi:hypothetical protein
MMTTQEITVRLRRPHEQQQKFIDSKAKRIIIRAGRRGGKTVGAAIKAIMEFLEGKRILYAAPTSEQTDRFWFEVNRALGDAVAAGIYKRNETERYIERPGTLNRIKAKTAWNANTLRGDYGDLIIFEEWQLMAEDAWEDVGAPMLLDNNGDAVFIYTPPSLKSTGISRARDPRHAAKMFKSAQDDKSGRWEAFHFTSHDNPYLSREGLAEIAQDMSRDSYLKEIMAEDDESQGNLLVYGCFDEKVCVVPRFYVPIEWMVYSGHDFGSANPAALFAAQNPAGDIFLFSEYAPDKGASTFQNVQAFQEIVAGRTVVNRVGGSHQEEEIRQGYTAQGWTITEPFINNIKAQIDRVKGLMEKNKIFIFNDLYITLMQLNTCMWKTDEYGKPTNEIKDEKRFHLLACLRYLCTLFSPDTVRAGGNKPKTKHSAAI